MSVTPALRAAARSAYRDLYRASSSTFAGDDRMLTAFRTKMKHDSMQYALKSDVAEYESSIKLTREVADVLRKNVVQAEKVQAADQEQDDLWRIRLTKDTEIGENDTIKSPPPLPPKGSRRTRVKCCSEPEPSPEAPPEPPKPQHRPLHTNYTTLKKLHKERITPELKEEDLEESFVRGSGPGGQSINKTENNVQLLHKPTGLRVQCQETRSLQTNRMLARRRLLEKLDQIENPGLSKGDLKQAKKRERERQRKKKARRKERLQESEAASSQD